MTHLCLDPPDRLDLSFRSNDDGVVGLAWIASMGRSATSVWAPPPDPTPVAMTAGTVSFQFDLPKLAFDEDGVPLPREAEVHVIASDAVAGDPGGWIDVDALAEGHLLAYVPHTVWASYATSTGVWDAVVVPALFDDAPVKCLARGLFVVEQGVSPPITVVTAAGSI